MLAVKCNPAVVKIEKRINKAVVKSAVKVIDKVYKDRDYARFYVLGERWPEFPTSLLYPCFICMKHWGYGEKLIIWKHILSRQ